MFLHRIGSPILYLSCSGRPILRRKVTNPGGPMSIAEIAQAARMGASIELVYTPLTEDAVQRDVDAIRATGVASVVLSSDLGQSGNPLHPDGLLALYGAPGPRDHGGRDR